jgi:hypothetical protein
MRLLPAESGVEAEHHAEAMKHSPLLGVIGKLLPWLLPQPAQAYIFLHAKSPL